MFKQNIHVYYILLIFESYYRELKTRIFYNINILIYPAPNSLSIELIIKYVTFPVLFPAFTFRISSLIIFNSLKSIRFLEEKK